MKRWCKFADGSVSGCPLNIYKIPWIGPEPTHFYSSDQLGFGEWIPWDKRIFI